MKYVPTIIALLLLTNCSGTKNISKEITTKSGLKYVVLKPGHGKVAKTGQEVAIYYSAHFIVTFERNIMHNRLMKFNWQQQDWPNFKYEVNEAENALFELAEQTGNVSGMLKINNLCLPLLRVGYSYSLEARMAFT